MRIEAALVAGLALGCAAPTRAHDPREIAEKHHLRRLLCPDIGHAACLRACPERAAPAAHAECLLSYRFGADPEALELARALARESSVLLGIDTRPRIEGYRGEWVDLHPALPVGVDRHHLVWLKRGLDRFATFVDAVRERAGRPVRFEPRPRGFVFFRTATTSYPSAYCWEGFVGYNLEGPLHRTERDMSETLFHELFHLNDAREDRWSERALEPIYRAIVEQCGDDHACYGPFAPHDTVVSEGTFYAFDARTRDVREYAAELALRYFLEQERQLAQRDEGGTPFKCLTRENRAAWELLAEAFFGGVDLTPECSPDVAR